MRALAACAVVLGGCELLVPVDGLSGGAEPGDAGPDAPTEAASTNDAATEASDAGTGDAGGDADAGLDCPANAIVCDRFERTTAAEDGWTSVGAPVITDRDSYSPTRSFVLRLTGSDYDWLQRVIDAPPGVTRIAFALHAPAAPGGFIESVKIAFGPTNEWDTATLTFAPEGLLGGLQTYDGSPTPTGTSGLVAPAASLYMSGWHRVEIVVDMRAMQKVMHATFDGMPAPDLTNTGHATVQSPAVLMVGSTYRAGGTASADAYMDDLVVAPVP